MYGLVCLPLVPLRATYNERSEMTSQLLFGEFVQIIEKEEKWIFIINEKDNYSGWVDVKMIKPISESVYEKGKNASKTILSNIFNTVKNLQTNQIMHLPAGSMLYNLKEDIFELGEDKWQIIDKQISKNDCINEKKIVEIAKSYLNVPYLWGGKSVLGIDCSGLTQVVFSIIGYTLPRNASQQAQRGKQIDFLIDVLPGDLAFFGDEADRITHVGIMIDNSHIIHSSGWVKIESIDSHGIISSLTGEYSHKLRVIKRILN